MKRHLQIYTVLILSFVWNLTAAQTWTQLGNCPGAGRRQGISFTINNSIYVGLGWSGTTSNRFNDLWEYNTTTATWTQKANFPGTARYGAVCFVINGKAYVGTGGLGGAQFVGDFFEYNPITNSWSQKANFPGGARDNAFGFSIGQKGYLGAGYSASGSTQNDFWEYTPTNDSWVQKASFPGLPRIGAFGFNENGYGYAGWGYGSATYFDLYRYNSSSNTWTSLSVPSATLQPSFIFPLNGSFYANIINNNVNQVYKFNSSINQWALHDTFPGSARYSNMTLQSNGIGYVYGGALASNTNNTTSDFWKFTEAVSCTLSSNFFSQDTLSGCGNLITLNAGNTGATYSWNTGSTTQSINVNSTGWYRCTVSQGITCSVTDSIYISLPNSLPANLQTGLVGYWPFCGNANDESGNGNNGLSFGATLDYDRFGNQNSCFSFNGISDFIQASDSGLPSGFNPYSFSAWIYLNQPQNNSWCTVLSYGTNNNTNLDNGKSNEFWMTSNLNPTQIISNNHRNRANRGVVDSLNYRGKWHMISFSKPTGDSLGSWYFDGQYIQTTDQNLGSIRDIQLSGELRIGKALTNTSPYDYHWYGKLDDIAVWNRTMTSTEIQQLYQNQSPCTLSSNFFAQDTLSSCGNLITLDAGNTGATYSWNTGATTQTINVNSNGWYRCIVTQGNICTANDSIYISLINVQITTPDTTICAGGTLELNLSNNSIGQNCFVPAAPLSSGMVGAFPFCGNNSDQSGLNNQVSNSGAVLIADRFGFNQSAYNFKPGNKMFRSSAITTGQNFTYMLWHKRNNLTIEGQGVGESNNTSTSGGGFNVTFNTPNYTCQGFTINVTNSTFIADTGKWYHYAVTKSGNLFKIYINGILNSQGNSAFGPFNSSTWFQIGGGLADCDLDDVFIFNRTLSDSEISTYYLSASVSPVSYLWSTGATTHSINVSPTQTTTYYVTVSNGISSCVDSVTVTVLPNTTWYADDDGDGYGSATDTVNSCTGAPSGYVGNNTDCNDLSATAYPGAAELCNSIDDDCDNLVDEGLAPVIGPVTGAGVQCIPLAPGSATFSIDPVPGATDYFWTAPAGTSITSANDTTSVTIAWNSANAHDGISGPLTVTVTGACGQLSSTQTIDIHLQISVPVRPASISGPVKLCPGDSATFSTASVSRARSYTWSVPPGINIVDGQGSNILRVVATAGFQGGTIAVSATNSCGTGPARSKTIGFNVPSTPGSISGTAAGLCGLQDIIYSVSSQTGITQYLWTAPAGTQLSGSGNSIQLDFDNTFANGNLSVVAINGCGTSLVRNLALTGYPARPGSIAGPLNLCPGSTAAYGVGTVNGTSSYTWTPISGATGLIGQGTKNISFTAPATSSTNNNLSVAASNGCGSSAVRSLGGITVDPAFCVRMGTKATTANISAYPNPAQDILFLKAEGIIPQRIEVYNMLGECLMYTNWKTEIDLSGLSNGMYLLRARYADGNAVHMRIELLR